MAEHLDEQAAKILSESGLPYDKKPKKFRISGVDKNLLEANKEALRSIAKLIKETWQVEG